MTYFPRFDVAFQCGPEPLHASRADFLTESSLSSPHGFAALTKGRIPIPRMLSTVRWHHDLSFMPPRIVPDLTTSSQTLIDQLREEALAHAATAEGMRRASKATQHLALDLALSRHVYAPQSFSKTDIDASGELDDSNLLSQATKAMSLSAVKPPPVRFRFLRPVANVPYKDEEKKESAAESTDEGLDIPLGVRLLISQWKIGENPKEYSYMDPYDYEEQADPPSSRKPVRRETRAREQAAQQAMEQASAPTAHNLRRPPLISTSRPPAGQPPIRTTSTFETHAHGLPASSPARHQPPFLPRKIAVTTNSQGGCQPDQYPYSSQEDLGPSTQPLPGPFGGGNRPSKRNVKKRMSGF